MKYVKDHPLMLDADYEYTAKDGDCKYDPSKGVGTVSDYKEIGAKSQEAMQAALNDGLVSVAIEGDLLQFYDEGIITVSDCEGWEELNHAVLAIGYGTDDETGMDYFIIKNSWGEDWGEKGYFRTEAEKDGAGPCGIQSEPSQPFA